MTKGLESFNALNNAFLMKCKDYRNNSCKVINIYTGEMYSPQELAEFVRKELKAFEIIKKYIVMNRAFDDLTKGNTEVILLEIKTLIPKEEYELLKGVL